jgi:protein TonB
VDVALKTLLDDPRFRSSVVIPIALAAWMILLAQFVNRLSLPSAQTPLPEQPTMEMRLVEIAPLPAAKPAPARNETAATPVHARHNPAPVHTIQPHLTPTPAIEHAIVKAENPSAPAPDTGPMPVPSESEKTAPPSNSTARVINQPMPALPDDLREDAYQAVAIARFDVHADGTVDVELSKPTPNPRLNAILLDALRKWRFFPAMQDGRAVESHQDVRVHFNVS